MNTQNKAVLIAGSMRFVSKTSFVFTFYEDATIWICSRYGALLFFFWRIIIEIKRLLAVFFSIFVYFFL